MPSPQITPERVQKRLVRVFTETFPDLEAPSAPAATMDNTPGWDSVATLALFSLIEENLGIKLGYDRIADAKSFAIINDMLVEKLA